MLLDTREQFLTVAAMALRVTAERARATRQADMLHRVAHVFWDHLARLQQLQELPLQLQ